MPAISNKIETIQKNSSKRSAKCLEKLLSSIEWKFGMERERQNSIESIHDSDDPLSSGGPSSRAGSIQTSSGSSEDENGEADAEEKDLVNLLKEQTQTIVGY